MRVSNLFMPSADISLQGNTNEACTLLVNNTVNSTLDENSLRLLHITKSRNKIQ